MSISYFLWFCCVLQGGGWCNTIRNCVYRKTTRRGSSKFMEKQLPFTGILSNKPEENPGREYSLCTPFIYQIKIFFAPPVLIDMNGCNCERSDDCIGWFPWLQISSTGTGSSYDTVMGHLLLETARMRLVPDHLLDVYNTSFS